MFIQKLGKCVYSERYTYLPCLFDSCLVLLLRDFACVCAQSCPTVLNLWTVACQAPLSMEFFRQAYWSGLPFPSRGIFPPRDLIHTSLHPLSHPTVFFFFKILDIQFTPSAYLLSVCYMLGIVVSAVFSSVAQSCPALCNPMDYSLPGSSVHGIFQARILELVAISNSRRSSQPRDLLGLLHWQMNSLPLFIF